MRLCDHDVHHGALPRTQTAIARLHFEPLWGGRLHLVRHHPFGDVGDLDPGREVSVRVWTEDQVMTRTEP